MSFSSGLHYGVPNAVYHHGLQSDPRPLSSTLAKNLLRKLPLEARWDLENGEHKDAYDEGQLLHELILEGQLTTGTVLDFDSYRTNAAKEARELARLEGKTPVLAPKLAPLEALADSVRARPDVAELLTGGQVEVSALTEIGGVPAQTRYDYLRLPDAESDGYIVDLKTVAGSAAPRDFERNGAAYAYHVQAALYQAALEALGYPKLPFYWLVVSKTEPYAHSIIEASEVDLMTGLEMVDRALEMWADITKNGWPQTVPVVQSAFPSWIHYENEEEVELTL